MSMDRFTHLLSDYLDHDLPRAEYDAVERHLKTCTECRETLAGLVAVKSRAASLVDPPAPTDLWAGIASRIGPAGSTSKAAGVRRAVVIELPKRGRAWGVPQWALAAAAFAVVAAAAVWFAQSRLVPAGVRPAQVATRNAQGTDARAVRFDADEIQNEIRDLQAAIERGRGKLAPETVRVLEENLRIIDKALGDARVALQQDPANRELEDYFASSVSKKLDMVKRAAELAGV
jgi:anti-sigma factor RsiW